jgi:hypothetical protein
LAHPIEGDGDVEFLHNEIARFKGTVTAATACQQEATSGQWRGSIPYLRLILCLTQDNIKHAFLRRGAPLSRQQFDARNSDQREQTVYEMIADLWNDETFNPVLQPSEVHSDFQLATDCSYEKVKTLVPATASKVENYLSSMRADLNRMIGNWERSGQGDAGYVAGDDTPETPARRLEPGTAGFGKLAGRQAKALGTRSSFLGGFSPYLLVLWELADSHQILESTLQ